MNQVTLFELEHELIPSDEWDENLLSKFPEEIQERLNSDAHEPIGIGYRWDVGYFCLAAGQGPHLIWSEREI